MNATDEQLIGQARKGLAASDAGNWEAAEAMTKLSERGMSGRDIATKVGCSETTVRNYISVYSAHGRAQDRGSWAEAMTAHRGDEWRRIPKTSEKRAELAAELLKDKAIYETPAVRQVVTRHSERQVREASAQWNRDHDVQTRAASDRERRRMSVVVNQGFWLDLLRDLNIANRKLNDAVGELERTGLPVSRSGEIVKAVRTLERTAGRFSAAAAERAIGAPINQTEVS